jgi:aminoglycoside 6'-N-acetyltransferase I
MRIIDLSPLDEVAISQTAELLLAGFKDHWPNSWTDVDSALEEVHESFGDDRLSRIAIDDEGQVLGWIGGIEKYDGHVWELHPLIVRPDRQGRGIGRALIEDFEAQISARQGVTIMLGSDDEDGMTSLAGVDLYPRPIEHLRQIRNLKGHPFEFY